MSKQAQDLQGKELGGGYIPRKRSRRGGIQVDLSPCPWRHHIMLRVVQLERDQSGNLLKLRQDDLMFRLVQDYGVPQMWEIQGLNQETPKAGSLLLRFKVSAMLTYPYFFCPGNVHMPSLLWKAGASFRPTCLVNSFWPFRSQPSSLLLREDWPHLFNRAI